LILALSHCRKHQSSFLQVLNDIFQSIAFSSSCSSVYSRYRDIKGYIENVKDVSFKTSTTYCDLCKELKIYLDRKDVKRMEAATNNRRDRLLIRLLYRLGCRVSECIGLEEHHIDFSSGTVKI
jgi:integrase